MSFEHLAHDHEENHQPDERPIEERVTSAHADHLVETGKATREQIEEHREALMAKMFEHARGVEDTATEIAAVEAGVDAQVLSQASQRVNELVTEVMERRWTTSPRDQQRIMREINKTQYPRFDEAN